MCNIYGRYSMYTAVNVCYAFQFNFVCTHVAQQRTMLGCHSSCSARTRGPPPYRGGATSAGAAAGGRRACTPAAPLGGPHDRARGIWSRPRRGEGRAGKRRPARSAGTCHLFGSRPLGSPKRPSLSSSSCEGRDFLIGLHLETNFIWNVISKTTKIYSASIV